MIRAGAFALLVATALGGAARAEVRVPPLTGPVVDAARVLDARSAAALERLSRGARALEGGSGPQLQYLLVPTLDGEAIESFAMRVAEAWKIGTKGKDNGVLVVVAVRDRKVRIEVGGGVEGGLTDAQAGRIIRTILVPAFREGRYGDGLYAAGRQILGGLGALPQGAEAPSRRAAARPQPVGIEGLVAMLLSMGSPLVLVIIAGLIVARIAIAARGAGATGPLGRSVRRGRRDGWSGGGWPGGWGGGGHGGGGGWSGGGGGFSGGGASGSW